MRNAWAKLSKQMRRLEEEFLATRKNLDEKTAELENAETEYRFLRGTGKFTPTKFVSPAASLNGDDDDINALGDTAETMDGVGSGEAGGSNDPIPGGVEAGDMDVSGSGPIQTRATGGLGKRRRLEFVAPSVDLLTAVFGQYSEAECNVLLDRIKRHLEELEDARGSEVLLEPDGEMDSSLLWGVTILL